MKKTFRDCLIREKDTRKFRLVGLECSGDLVSHIFNMYEPIDFDGDDYEWKYALIEHIEEINALQIEESIFVYLNRDNHNEKAVVMRIS